MSRRHRNQDLAPVPRADVRAHAHNERHRVHSELHLVEEAVRNGLEPIDVEEPGPEWKPVHHHDAQVGLEKSRRPKVIKHWKTKEWKRRKALRRQRAREWERLAEAG